ncbi:MAG: hypothetical protein J0H65_07210, partial [Rhizobiales bacterium]|nr:hypothetical protein [Hyphomicrobiales bacterium]
MIQPAPAELDVLSPPAAAKLPGRLIISARAHLRITALLAALLLAAPQLAPSAVAQGQTAPQKQTPAPAQPPPAA